MALFTTSRPKIAVKSISRFPARVTADTGIDLTISNGEYNFSLDYTQLGTETIANPADWMILGYNETTGEYRQVAVNSLANFNIDFTAYDLASTTDGENWEVLGYNTSTQEYHTIKAENLPVRQVYNTKSEFLASNGPSDFVQTIIINQQFDGTDSRLVCPLPYVRNTLATGLYGELLVNGVYWTPQYSYPVMDIRQWGADPRFGDPDTGAIVHEIISGQYQYPRIQFRGNFYFATSPDFSLGGTSINPIVLEIDGNINLTETLVLPVNVSVVGMSRAVMGGFQDRAVGASIAAVVGESPDPLIEFVPGPGGISGGHELRNIALGSPTGVGIKVNRTSNVFIENVSCQAQAGNANSIPLVVDTSFWVTINDCSFLGNTGANTYPVQFLQYPPNSMYCGLIRVNHMNMQYRGILLKWFAGTGSGGSFGDFLLNDVHMETGDSGGAFLTVDTSEGGVCEQLHLVRPRLYDTGPPFYAIKTIGEGMADIEIYEPYNLHNSADLSDGTIGELTIRGGNKFLTDNSISSAITSFYPWYPGWMRLYDHSLDAQLVCAPRGPHVIPYTTRQMLTPTTLIIGGGSISLTNGVLAPDGSLDAWTFTGTGTHYVGVNSDPTFPAIALGDWFICGCWVKDLVSGHNPRLPYFYSAKAGFNGAANGAEMQMFSDYTYESANAWKWVLTGFKCTSTQNAVGEMLMWMYPGTGGAQTAYYNPGIIYIPASAGYSDADIAYLLRTLQPWPSNAQTNEVSTPAGQAMRVGALRTNAPRTVTTSTATMAATDSDIIVNYAGTCTLTLLAASTCPGHEITIRTITANTAVSASSNVVPLIGGSAGTAILAATAGKWARLKSDGTDWQIMAAG